MIRNWKIGTLLMFFFMVTGCATVPMAPKNQDLSLKTFTKPSSDKAGLYVYRNSYFGAALKKNIYVNEDYLGESASKVYFYKIIEPGLNKISTESEFSDNSIELQAEGGNNYFVEQYIKMGVFVGGANLKIVSEEEGMKNVLECNLAK